MEVIKKALSKTSNIFIIVFVCIIGISIWFIDEIIEMFKGVDSILKFVHKSKKLTKFTRFIYKLKNKN